MATSDKRATGGPLDRIAKPDLHLETTSRLAQLVASAKPGTRLPTERSLSAQLGVGRSTLREAMRSLAFIGAIQPRQGSGTYVTAMDDGAVDRLIGLALMAQSSTVQEVVAVRRVLEVEAVRLAAEQRDEADLRELEEIMRSMRESRDDPGSASRYDLQFHVVLARASHNRVMVLIINGMRALLEIWMKTAVNREPVIAAIVEEHERILAAVAARDASGAAEAMAAHLTRAAERLFSVIGADSSMTNYVSLLFLRDG